MIPEIYAVAIVLFWPAFAMDMYRCRQPKDLVIWLSLLLAAGMVAVVWPWWLVSRLVAKLS